MNYIWEVFLTTKKMNISINDLNFHSATTLTPYMETSFNDLNASNFDKTIEINVFYRFGEIFQFLLNDNVDKNSEFRDTLFDILIHFLVELDIMQGLSKKEYYGLFCKEDISNGVYGKEKNRIIEIFPYEQRRIITESMVKLYTIGTSIELLQNVLKQLYDNSIVYLDSVDKKSILIYVGKKETEELKLQLQFILDLFVSIDYNLNIFWNVHFGIVGVDETMEINNFTIY